MRAPVATGSTIMPAPSFVSRHATRFGSACVAVLAAVVLFAITLFVAADEANAQRGFSRGSFGGGGGFSRGGFSRGGMTRARTFTTSGRTARMATGRGGRFATGGGRVSRAATSGRRAGRAGTSRTSRVSRTQRGSRVATGTRDRGRATGTRGTPSRQATNNPRPGTKPPQGNCRARNCGPTEGGGTKPPGTRPPGTKPPSGGDHRRAISYGGGGHTRSVSYGGGHRRYGSYGGGHHRRTSFGVRPPFTPPVPPPSVVSNPPPPPPPTGGGAAPPSTPRPQQSARQFGGPPPSGEQRYVPNEVMVVLRDDLTEAQIAQFLRDHRLARTAGGDVRIGLINARVFRFRILGGRSVPAVIAALQNDPRGISYSPNYIYQLAEMEQRATTMVRTASGGMRPATSNHHSMQYVIERLNLRRAHQVSRGERVLIAVIDSGVDGSHPELDGTIVDQIDVTEDNDQSPHYHGTSMTGAIVSQAQLLGVAPGARVLAIKAFSPRNRTSAHGTSHHIALAIQRAVEAGVRVINLSLSGPHDPYIEKIVREAHARGIVIVAAAGNKGPNAAPEYPAAYPEVIAVTATDSQGRIYKSANQGAYVAISAPGVDVLVATPRGGYGMSTGTSVATAHVSGIIALMLSRNPSLDPDTLRQMLLRSVHAANGNGGGGRDNQFGYGHADAHLAIVTAGPPQPETPVATGIDPARAQ